MGGTGILSVNDGREGYAAKKERLHGKITTPVFGLPEAFVHDFGPVFSVCQQIVPNQMVIEDDIRL
jgi:hypothetical protein